MAKAEKVKINQETNLETGNTTVTISDGEKFQFKNPPSEEEILKLQEEEEILARAEAIRKKRELPVDKQPDPKTAHEAHNFLTKLGYQNLPPVIEG